MVPPKRDTQESKNNKELQSPSVSLQSLSNLSGFSPGDFHLDSSSASSVGDTLIGTLSLQTKSGPLNLETPPTGPGDSDVDERRHRSPSHDETQSAKR